MMNTEQKATIKKDAWRYVLESERLRKAETRWWRHNYTRRAMDNKGEIGTVIDSVRKRTSGFQDVKDNGRLHLSFEALVLKHAECFEPDLVAVARRRLAEAAWDGRWF